MHPLEKACGDCIDIDGIIAKINSEGRGSSQQDGQMHVFDVDA